MMEVCFSLVYSMDIKNIFECIYYLFKRAELIIQAIVSIRNNQKLLKTKFFGLKLDL